jgi:hypothetical protein
MSAVGWGAASEPGIGHLRVFVVNEKNEVIEFAWEQGYRWSNGTVIVGLLGFRVTRAVQYIRHQSPMEPIWRSGGLMRSIRSQQHSIGPNPISRSTNVQRSTSALSYPTTYMGVSENICVDATTTIVHLDRQ